MSEMPAFNVRSYPPFRMARLFRAYVDRDALYLIRMRGVVGIADAGSGVDFHPGRVLAAKALRWWARTSQDTAARELDERGPRALLDANRLNLRVEPNEVVGSRLGPARLFGHGEHLACWTLEVRGRKRMTFQVEDEASLKTALEHLPRLLGPALSVSVGWDAARGRPVRTDPSSQP